MGHSSRSPTPTVAAPGERLMASKDKGGRSSKTVAASTPKEKKQAKRDKKKQRGSSAKDL
jgi:hypothetical protein